MATIPYDCHVDNYDDITLLRPDEVAKALGITTDTVYKWCSRGLLPHYRLEKCIRFKLEDVQEFLAQRRIEPN